MEIFFALPLYRIRFCLICFDEFILRWRCRWLPPDCYAPHSSTDTVVLVVKGYYKLTKSSNLRRGTKYYGLRMWNLVLLKFAWICCWLRPKCFRKSYVIDNIITTCSILVTKIGFFVFNKNLICKIKIYPQCVKNIYIESFILRIERVPGGLATFKSFFFTEKFYNSSQRAWDVTGQYCTIFHQQQSRICFCGHREMLFCSMWLNTRTSRFKIQIASLQCLNKKMISLQDRNSSCKRDLIFCHRVFSKKFCNIFSLVAFI